MSTLRKLVLHVQGVPVKDSPEKKNWFSKKKYIYTGENKTDQLHAIHICLRNEITTRGNVLPKLPNLTEIHVTVFFTKTNIFRGYLLVKHPVQG